MENVKLSGWQIMTLAICFVIGTTFVVLPGGLIATAKQYSWIVVMLACLYGLTLAFGWLYLIKRHPGLSLVQISVKVLGKWFGGLVAVLYIIYFLQIASWVTRNLSDFMHLNLMPRTPLSVFNIVVLIVCAYAVTKGIETIAFVCQIVLPFIILSFWIPFSVFLKEWDWLRFHMSSNINFWHAMLDTKYTWGFPYMETVSFLMLLPYAGHKAKKGFIIGIVAAGLMFAISIFFTVGILGVYRSAHLTYPIYVIFREMQLSKFIEHLEAVLSINLLLLVFLKLSILFYCAVLGICQLFQIKDRASIAYPTIWVISAYSLLFKNIIENMEWVQRYLFPYYTLYGVILPAVLVGATWIQEAREKQASALTP